MSQEYLENIPFDELQIGQKAYLTRTVTEQDIRRFAALSGDFNPLHLDEDYARTTIFGGRIAHGLFSALLLTAAVATKLPGPGTIYRGQEMKFQRAVKLEDTLTVELEVLEKKRRGNIVMIGCTIRNQRGETVFSGVSTAIAPTEKLRVPVTPISFD